MEKAGEDKPVVATALEDAAGVGHGLVVAQCDDGGCHEVADEDVVHGAGGDVLEEGDVLEVDHHVVDA